MCDGGRGEGGEREERDGLEGGEREERERGEGGEKEGRGRREERGEE